MKLLYAKSNWEAAHLPLPAFLEKAARDGFDAAEIYLPGRPEPPPRSGGSAPARG